jgi:hypothetical protein
MAFYASLTCCCFDSATGLPQWPIKFDHPCKLFFMAKKITPATPLEIPDPDKFPETNPPFDPEEPVIPDEDPDIIPDEDPFENPPPYEIPEPGEGP